MKLMMLILDMARFRHEDPSDNKSAFIQVMAACCLFGDKSLPERMMTKVYDAIWHHYATMS